ncbi:MAG: site-2 protease family protein [Thermoguttaceae bacterium]|jgi:Zn-dependent protease
MDLNERYPFLAALVVGLTVHEFAHAWVASLLGDDFARRQGRVSLNPLRHLAPLGTLAILMLPFGWGRPVPVNLYNFKHPRRDYLLTSLAGPLSNLLMVAVCLGLMLLARHPYGHGPLAAQWINRAYGALALVAIINMLLATFNLIPIPPLDGSKIWPCLIPGMKPGMPVKGGRFFLLLLVILIFTNSLGRVYDVAVNSVEKLMPPSDAMIFRIYQKLGDAALADENWSTAERAFSLALNLNPQSDRCYFERARARAQQGDFSKAIADVSRAIEILPDAKYYAFRADMDRALNRPHEAEQDDAAAHQLNGRR